MDDLFEDRVTTSGNSRSQTYDEGQQSWASYAPWPSLSSWKQPPTNVYEEQSAVRLVTPLVPTVRNLCRQHFAPSTKNHARQFAGNLVRSRLGQEARAPQLVVLALRNGTFRQGATEKHLLASI